MVAAPTYHLIKGRGIKGEGLINSYWRQNDVSGMTLCNAIEGMAKSGATVITDGWTGYAGLEQVGYGHQTIRSDYSIGEDMLPRCHRVASLLKRFLKTIRINPACARYLHNM